jgi:hypothetical protein
MELICLHLYFKINLQVYVQNNVEIVIQFASELIEILSSIWCQK